MVTANELEPFDEPHTLEEAQQLINEARRLRARAEDIHDQALGSAIRLALRGGRRLSEIPELLDITHSQARRYVGRDDVKLLPINLDAAVDVFLRYLSKIDRDDISWTRGDQLYIQPTAAVDRVAALAARDGREFPYTVRTIGEGLMNRGVVQGAGRRSSVTRTRHGEKHKVWVLEAILLEDIDLAWNADFTDPLARSFRALEHIPHTARTTAAEEARIAALRFLDYLALVETSSTFGGLERFGAVRSNRLYITDPTRTIHTLKNIARAQGEHFITTTPQVEAGLHAISALKMDSAGRLKVGRRIDGKLQRVWDLDRSFIPAAQARYI
ncbi:hypothetical protein [Microbacterium sp. NPDC091662]|uniref:hypothetical protein n=1 Tax=Microbacterium sp. NPDC091662 TaxID=3364211 RepID=UPI0038072A6A